MPGQEFPIPFSNYGSTRLDVDEQSRINLFPNSDGGLQTPPGLKQIGTGGVSPKNNEAKSWLNTSLDFHGFTWSRDGSKFYTIKEDADTLYEYTCTTRYDVTTRGDAVTFAFTHAAATEYWSVRWSRHGEYCYIVEDTNIQQYAASTPFDISTLVFDDVYDISTEFDGIDDIAFNNDGTIMFAVGDAVTARTIHAYDLATKWDVTTATVSADLFTETDNSLILTTGPDSIVMSPDGLTMIICSRNLDKMVQYTLATAFTLAGATLYGILDLDAFESSWTHVTADFSASGNDMYLMRNSGNVGYLHKFDTESFDISGKGFFHPQLNDSFAPTIIADLVGSFAFKADGTKIFGLEFSPVQWVEYDLSTAWDITTMSAAADATFTPTAGSGGNGQLRFNPAGTIAYHMRFDRIIYQYTLGVAWDITSAVYASKSYNLSALGTSVHYDFALNSDGSRLYSIDSDGIIYQHNLSTPYDLATASNSSNTANVKTLHDIDHVFGLDLAQDDRITAAGYGFAFEVVMSTANDLSTASAGDIWNFASDVDPGNNVDIIAWGNSGTKIYLHEDANIHEFDAVIPYRIGIADDARGAENMAGVYYAVIGDALFSFSSAGVPTYIDEVEGSARCDLETDGDELVICTGAKIYSYTTGGGLVETTDASINDTAKTSGYMDLRFHYQQPNGQFCASALNDSSTIDGADFATAESFDDDLLCVKPHNQLLYLMGEKRSEPWKTTGVSRPPLRRQAVFQRGIVSEFAFTAIDDHAYFVDEQRRLNRITGLSYEPLPMGALPDEIEDYTTVSDAYLLSFSYNDENYIEIYFPTANASWTYHEPTQTWTKREDGNGNRFRAAAYTNVYGKVFVLDRAGAHLYEFDESTYVDGEGWMTRVADSALINSNQLGVAINRLHISWVKLRYEVKGGEADIILSMSKDPDLTSFGAERVIRVSGSGVISEPRWGRARECIIRTRVRSNAAVTLSGLSVELNVKKDTND